LQEIGKRQSRASVRGAWWRIGATDAEAVAARIPLRPGGALCRSGHGYFVERMIIESPWIRIICF